MLGGHFADSNDGNVEFRRGCADSGGCAVGGDHGDVRRDEIVEQRDVPLAGLDCRLGKQLTGRGRAAE